MSDKLDVNLINDLLDSNEIRVANLCTGTRADGSEFFVYLLQTYRQMNALQQVLAIGASLDFSEFGEVIAYGEGTEPPEDVKKEVEEKYQLSHEFEKELEEGIKELQEEFSRMKKRGISEQEFLKQKIKALVEAMQLEQSQEE